MIVMAIIIVVVIMIIVVIIIVVIIIVVVILIILITMGETAEARRRPAGLDLELIFKRGARRWGVRPVLESSICKDGPAPGRCEPSEGHFQVRIGNGSGS